MFFTCISNQASYKAQHPMPLRQTYYSHPPKGPQTQSATGGGRYTMTRMVKMMVIVMMMMMILMMMMMILVCFLHHKRPPAQLEPRV